METTGTDEANRPAVALPRRDQARVLLLRAVHFVLARIGLVYSIVLLLFLGERAAKESTPPIRPWIIYMHAILNVVSSTGVSSRFFSTPSVYVFSLLQLHMGYLFLFEARLDFPDWLRLRAGLHSLATSGAHFRLLSAGRFEVTSGRDKVASGILGLVSGLYGLLFLQTGPSLQESLGAGGCLLACLAYTFPVVASLPRDGQTGQRVSQLLERLVTTADLLLGSAVTGPLLLGDLDFALWQGKGVPFWLQARFLLDDAVLVLCLIVGQSLNWLQRVVKSSEQKSS